MRLEQIAVLRPGGNDTALVFDFVPQDQHKKVNAYIQEKRPEIEQVMFVHNSPSGTRGIMAGGEFCGNATRALGYYLLKGKDGSVSISVSGAELPLTVTVKNQNASTQMPILTDLDSVKIINNSAAIVHLQGISHLILNSSSMEALAIISTTNTQEKKRLSCQLFSRYGLLQYPAAGVMILSEENSKLTLTPYVYVKEVDTFYAETACGSGSVAVGLLAVKKQGRSIQNMQITQPSAEEIMVDVSMENGAFKNARINGKVEILYEGTL